MWVITMMREKTGITGFDELIQGGLIEKRVYLVSGPPGGGKTTFGVQFLAYGATIGEIGLYVTLSESPQNIVSDMSNYSLNIPTLIKLKKLLFLDLGPTLDYGYGDDLHGVITTSYDSVPQPAPESEAPSPFIVYKEIQNFVKQYEVQRVVIDSVSAIRFTTLERSQEEKEMSRFMRNMKKLGCTTIILSELTDPSTYSTEQFTASGVVFMHNFMREDSMVRAVQIIKMRGTEHDCDMRKVMFNKQGLQVLDRI